MTPSVKISNKIKIKSSEHQGRIEGEAYVTSDVKDRPRDGSWGLDNTLESGIAIAKEKYEKLQREER